MTATTRRHPLSVALAALVLALAGALVPAPSAAAAEAATLHALLNEARWSQGLAGLLRNGAMDAVAADWAAQLAASGTLSHNPNYSAQIPGGWVRAAENVAQGHPTAAAMHEGWMNSSGHRANILGDYTDVGIAFLSAGGTTWGVQVFAAYPGHVGPAPPAPPPPPAPAPPADPPAGESAEPTPTATPSPTPSATRDASPTPSPTPGDGGDAADVGAVDGAGGTPLAIALLVAVLLAAAAAATVGFVRRRRGSPAGAPPRSDPGSPS